MIGLYLWILVFFIFYGNAYPEVLAFQIILALAWNVISCEIGIWRENRKIKKKKLKEKERRKGNGVDRSKT